MIETTKKLIFDNKYYDEKLLITPHYLVLHSTGDGVSSALSHYRYYNSEKARASVHAFIDANDGEIIQTLEWNQKAMHLASSFNSLAIGVEMCEPEVLYNAGSGTIKELVCAEREFVEMVERTYRVAVELFAHLAVQFGIPIENIVSHHELGMRGDASRHVDPTHLWVKYGHITGNVITMDDFREDVLYVISTVVYNTLDELPSAYREPVEKLVSAGVIQGDDKGLSISRDMARMITYMDRLGLIPSGDD